jgi:hypothetical protein
LFADLAAQPTTAGGSVLDGSGLDGGVLSAEDLEVGGKYHIPKRKKFGWLHKFSVESAWRKLLSRVS